MDERKDKIKTTLDRLLSTRDKYELLIVHKEAAQNDVDDVFDELASLTAERDALKAEVDGLRGALDAGEMLFNPTSFRQAAIEIDCGSECRNQQCGSGPDDYPCTKWEQGEYCPGAVARTLEALCDFEVNRLSQNGEG